jgi:hypothetical protein
VDSAETIQIIVRNSTGTTLTKGQVVYLSGATGNRPNAVLSQAHTEATSSKTIGIVVANITNNSDGYVAVNGTLHDLDTSAFTAGDAVWLSAATAGAMTSTIPAEPNHTVFIGYIARAHPTQGRIVILIQNGYELNELHGVLISSEANNDLLVYETSTTLWKNKSISTIFGGTPLVSVPTLAQVTTAGNTTTNAITVGGLTSTLANANVTHVGANAKGFYIRNNADSLVRAGLQFDGNTAYVELLGRYQNGPAFIRQDGANGNISFLRDGSEYLRIFGATGNTAIGTTTDAGYKLDVNGTARIATSLEITSASGISLGNLTALSYSGATLNIGSSASWSDIRFFTGGALKFSQTSSLTTITNTTINLATTTVQLAGINALTYSGTDIRIGSVAAYFNSLSLYVAGSEKARILSNGNFLVGTTTDSGAKVTVAGSITAASLIAQGVYFNNTLVAAANNDVLVGLDINPTFTNGAFTGIQNLAVRIASTTSIVRIDSSVVGSFHGIEFSNSGNIDTEIKQRPSSGEFRISNGRFAGWGGFITLYTDTAERMRIRNNGNVLIGATADAGYKLDVNGTARFSNDIRISTSSGATIFLGVDVNNTVRVTDTYAKFQIQKTSIGGAISINGGGQASTTYTLTDTGHAFGLGSNNTTADTITITRPFRGNVVATTKTILNISTSNETALINATLLRGIYFNPTITDWANIRAIETTAGDVIFNGGNVGIGLTPIYKLDVNGAVRFQSTGTSSVTHSFLFRNENNAYGGFTIGSSGQALSIQQASGYGYLTAAGFFIGSTNSNIWTNNGSILDIKDAAGTTTYLRVASTTGNLLIGTTTDAGYKLDVNGTARLNGLTSINTTSVANTALAIAANGIGAGNFIIQGYDASANNRFYITASGNFRITGLTDTAIAGNDEKFRLNFSFSPTSGTREHMGLWLLQTINQTGGANGITRGLYVNPTITAAADFRAIETTAGNVIFNGGNVGIGTATPSYPFHISSAAAANIYGTVQSTSASGTAAWVAFNDQSDNVVYRVFGSGASGTQMGIALARSASLIANLGGAGSFLLGTYSATNFIMGTSNAEKMRIVDSTGNILIATTTDLGNKLEVSGSINATDYKVGNVAGWNGIINIPTMPPVMITVTNGIITNVM